MALLFSPTRVRTSICRFNGSCVVTRAHFIQPEPPVQHLVVRYSTGLCLLNILFYVSPLSVEFQVANRSSVLCAHTEEKECQINTPDDEVWLTAFEIPGYSLHAY